jgi:hypothetical protein
MTLQNGNANDGVARFVDDLNGAIRENPVSAGLVGLGVLWMFFGSAKIAGFANAWPGATKQVTNTLRSATEAAGTAAAERVGRVSEAAHHTSESVKVEAQEAAHTITSATQDLSRASSEMGTQVGQSIQKNVTMTIEQQPLLLGVLGVGIGAGIASMFSSTTIEQELMGEAGGVVTDKIRDLAGQAAQHAENVFHDVKREAVDHDLTAASAEKNLKNVGEKVKNTTRVVKESVLSRP